MTSAISRILVVEDEDDIREVTIVALETLGGFTVEPCASGTEIVEKAQAFQPDLVLLDVMMPSQDGPQSLKKLRDAPGFEKTPVIFITAKAMPEEIDRIMALGAIGVITKPFDPITLCAQIKEFLNASLGDS